MDGKWMVVDELHLLWIFMDEIIHDDVGNGDVNDDVKVVIYDILTYSLSNTMYPMNILT
jgi:hypothetical protein